MEEKLIKWNGLSYLQHTLYLVYLYEGDDVIQAIKKEQQPVYIGAFESLDDAKEVFCGLLCLEGRWACLLTKDTYLFCTWKKGKKTLDRAVNDLVWCFRELPKLEIDSKRENLMWASNARCGAEKCFFDRLGLYERALYTRSKKDLWPILTIKKN